MSPVKNHHMFFSSKIRFTKNHYLPSPSLEMMAILGGFLKATAYLVVVVVVSLTWGHDETPHNNKPHTPIPWQQIRFKRQVAARFCNLCWRYATCCCNTWHSAKNCWGGSGMEVVLNMMTGCMWPKKFWCTYFDPKTPGLIFLFILSILWWPFPVIPGSWPL